MYALISDCTPNNGTIVAIGDASELLDLFTDDTWRAIRIDDATVSVGDRISIDWNSQAVNLSDCL